MVLIKETSGRGFSRISLLIVMILTVACDRGDNMDNDAIKLLKNNVKKFNEIYSGKEIDLSSENLRGLKIKNADLRGVNLTSANLENTYFKDSLLSHADLTGSLFGKTVFDNCKMNNVKITGTNIEEVLIKQCEMRESDLHESHLIKVKFDQTNLTRSNLNRLTIDDGVFYKSEHSTGQKRVKVNLTI